MGLFRSKQPEPADTTARDYLATAPPGARTEVLASACVLGATELRIAAPEQFGCLVTYQKLTEVDDLVQRLLYQDDDFAAAVARKIALDTFTFADSSRTKSVEKWIDKWLGANGVKQGDKTPIEVVGGQDDPDSAGQNLAGLFWMTFNAVVLGRTNAPEVYWRFYSSLYTDPERHGLSYSIIAWGAVALARLINTGELSRSVPVLGDEYRTIPRLTGSGWYPLPNKAQKLPNGDAPVKCYWDGARWTDRCRVWTNGRFQDATHSPHDPPID
jgi:hypothetical protein